jgi:GMP synthase-like glutamine amidotransferase
MTHQKILILDFGSQVTQLIARRVREAHVFCEVHPCDVSDEWVKAYAADGNLKGVILSGSHASVYEDETDKVIKSSSGVSSFLALPPCWLLLCCAKRSISTIFSNTGRFTPVKRLNPASSNCHTCV